MEWACVFLHFPSKKFASGKPALQRLLERYNGVLRTIIENKNEENGKKMEEWTFDKITEENSN